MVGAAVGCRLPRTLALSQALEVCVQHFSARLAEVLRRFAVHRTAARSRSFERQRTFQPEGKVAPHRVLLGCLRSPSMLHRAVANRCCPCAVSAASPARSRPQTTSGRACCWAVGLACGSQVQSALPRVFYPCLAFSGAAQAHCAACSLRPCLKLCIGLRDPNPGLTPRSSGHPTASGRILLRKGQCRRWLPLTSNVRPALP